MKKIKLPTIITIPFQALKRMMNEDGPMAAGYISFTAFLSIFPFLIFLVALAGVISTPEDIPEMVDLMFEFLPKEVAEAMAPAVAEVINTKPTGLLTFGFIGMLWAASNGFESLRAALNRAYHVKKKRALWRRRLQSILFVGLAAFLIFFLSLMVLFGPVIWNLAEPILHFSFAQAVIFNVTRYGSALFVLMGALLMLHRFLPNRELRVLPLIPGVVFTTIAFLLGGTAFSMYIANFGDFSVTYGSLGSIAIALLFFYFNAIFFIYGAYLNVEIAENKNEKIKVN